MRRNCPKGGEQQRLVAGGQKKVTDEEKINVTEEQNNESWVLLLPSFPPSAIRAADGVL